MGTDGFDKFDPQTPSPRKINGRLHVFTRFLQGSTAANQVQQQTTLPRDRGQHLGFLQHSHQPRQLALRQRSWRWAGGLGLRCEPPNKFSLSRYSEPSVTEMNRRDGPTKAESGACENSISDLFNHTVFNIVSNRSNPLFPGY